MQIVYKQMGLDQTPWRWRPHEAPRPGFPIALALVPSQGGTEVSTETDNAESPTPLLLSGALGGLQVVDPTSAKVLSSVGQFIF